MKVIQSFKFCVDVYKSWQNQIVFGIRLIKSLFFFPFVISQVVIGLIFTWFYQPNYGVIAPFLNLIGLEGVILGIALSFLPYIKRIYSSLKNDKIDFSLIRPRMGFIINSYALDLSRTFSGYTDKLIVAPLFGFAILGNYQLGIQVLAVLTILPGIVYQYILPRDSSGDSNKKLKKLTIAVSIVLAGLGFILAPLILPILFPKYTEAIEVIQIVSISVIPATINLMYISKFLGNELSKVVLTGSGIFLSVQIVSIFILGELFGVNGVAIALVLGASAEAIFLMTVNKLIYKLTD